jgi:hypothetical protein
MRFRRGSSIIAGGALLLPLLAGTAEADHVGNKHCGDVISGFVELTGPVVDKATGGRPTPNVIVADYSELPDRSMPAEKLLNIGQSGRDAVENTVAAKVAQDLIERLPRTPQEFEEFIERGYEIARQMSWDVVARDFVVPGIQRAIKANRLKQIA